MSRTNPLQLALVSECYASLCDHVHLNCDPEERDVGRNEEQGRHQELAHINLITVVDQLNYKNVGGVP